jgi:hypothetical protein
MKESNICLLQYARGKEKLNLFYAGQDMPAESVQKMAANIAKSPSFKGASLDEIAGAVEASLLEKRHALTKLHGIKRILKSYDKIISPKYLTRIELA